MLYIQTNRLKLGERGLVLWYLYHLPHTRAHCQACAHDQKTEEVPDCTVAVIPRLCRASYPWVEWLMDRFHAPITTNRVPRLLLMDSEQNDKKKWLRGRVAEHAAVSYET